MRFFYVDEQNWPCGISDGLNLPCAVCGTENIQFDYNVDDELWNLVVPEGIRRDVICLPCLDRLAKAKGRNIGAYIKFIQFIGLNETVEFVPCNVFLYK